LEKEGEGGEGGRGGYSKIIKKMALCFFNKVIKEKLKKCLKFYVVIKR